MALKKSLSWLQVLFHFQDKSLIHLSEGYIKYEHNSPFPPGQLPLGDYVCSWDLTDSYCLTSGSVPCSVWKDGGCWIQLYFCRNQKPVPSIPGVGTASLADTLHVSNSLQKFCQNFCLSGFSSEALLSADFSTAKLSLHHHRGRTVTTFTANLVQERDISLQASCL